MCGRKKLIPGPQTAPIIMVVRARTGSCRDRADAGSGAAPVSVGFRKPAGREADAYDRPPAPPGSREVGTTFRMSARVLVDSGRRPCRPETGDRLWPWPQSACHPRRVRRSRAREGDPVNTVGGGGYWVPAFAGMTSALVSVLTAHPPSPLPTSTPVRRSRPAPPRSRPCR